jgi:hypothetical protein
MVGGIAPVTALKPSGIAAPLAKLRNILHNVSLELSMGGNSKGKKSSDDKMADLERRMAQVELEEKRNAALLWWQDIKYEMLKLKEAQTAEAVQVVGFVTDQFAQRTVQYGYVQRAITLASNDYTDILKTQASKEISLGPLLTFAAFALLPEYLALAGTLKEIAGNAEFRKSVAAPTAALKTLGKTIDFFQKTAEQIKTPTEKIKNEYAAANTAIKAMYDKVLGEQALTAAILHELSTVLLDGTYLSMTTMRAMFNKCGLQIVTPQTVQQLAAASDVLAEMLLYDMLHSYTKQYVTLEIAGSEDGESLEDVTDNRVEFEGLNDQQRRVVFDRFKHVPWKHAFRQPVGDWDDLALSWDAQVIYRPGKMFLKHNPNSPAQRAGWR